MIEVNVTKMRMHKGDIRLCADRFGTSTTVYIYVYSYDEDMDDQSYLLYENDIGTYCSNWSSRKVRR